MKRTILAIAIAMSLGFVQNVNAVKMGLLDQMSAVPYQGGGETPFPFGQEIPFPWNAIEGIWQVEDKTINAFFSFQVTRDQSGVSTLKVIHIDPQSGRVMGKGAGFANQSQKIVRALMKGESSNYLVFVRVFRNLRINNRLERQATVLSVRTFGDRSTPEKEWHLLLHKVNNRPAQLRK